MLNKLPRWFRIPLIYCIFSILWVVSTDQMNALISPDLRSATWVSIVKGLLFVVFSTLLIYFLLRADERAKKSLETKLGDVQNSFAALFEQNPEPMWIADPENDKFLAVNKAALKTFGYTRSEFLGLQIHDLFITAEHTALQSLLRLQIEGTRRTGPWTLVTKTNQNIYFNILLVEIEFSGRQTYLTTAIDISEQKTTEDALKQRTNERDEFEFFGYSISHDLRGYTRAILGYSQILREDFAKKLSPEARDMLEKMTVAAEGINHTIKSLQTLTGISRTPMNIQYLDLADLAKKTAEHLKRQEPERAVKFAIQSNLQSYGDAEMLQVLLYDLFDNAWKYTRMTTSPLIEFGCNIDAEGKQVFFVRDNGIGFDQSKVPDMFEPFKRFHNSQEFPGSGIGLSVASRIVERHKGKIWAEGELGKGATFFFVLGMDESNPEKMVRI